MGLDTRKPVFRGFANNKGIYQSGLSDKCLWCSLIKNIISESATSEKFNFLASVCSPLGAGWFGHDLVGNHKDRISFAIAHMIIDDVITVTFESSMICRERSGSVVECLTPDWGAAGSSLTGVTALCPWARHINPSLVLVQPRKTCPYITERLLMGCKESDQTIWYVSAHEIFVLIAYCITHP